MTKEYRQLTLHVKGAASGYAFEGAQVVEESWSVGNTGYELSIYEHPNLDLYIVTVSVFVDGKFLEVRYCGSVSKYCLRSLVLFKWPWPISKPRYKKSLYPFFSSGFLNFCPDSIKYRIAFALLVDAKSCNYELVLATMLKIGSK